MADDFEKRVTYIVGRPSIDAICNRLAAQNLAGDVLELGAGNGTYSAILARIARKLYVTDLSEDMMQVCAKRLEGNPNVTIEKQDCCALTYPDNRFDVVVMINLLHVIPDPAEALAQCRRVLKPGGSLVVVSFTSEGMAFLAKLGMIFRYLRAFGKPPTKSRTLTVASTRTLLEAQEFEVREDELIGVKTKAVFARAVRR